ncbi:MAG: DUF5615 family PIN-like protein [Pirellulales bacterium]|nr:DUF5615 family PIN-like protein [Pirellulales bacterium]
MKFLVDMPLSPALAAWLGNQGHDALHASELGLSAAADGEILERASEERRVIVTADLDFPRLLALTQLDEPGLVLFRGGNYSELETIDRLKKCLESISIDDFPRSIIVIEKERIRQRHLPL